MLRYGAETQTTSPVRTFVSRFETVLQMIVLVGLMASLRLQRNLRRDKDRRNMTQFNMQTLPKSAKQKER